jgi:hypothetical protein
MRPKFSRKQLVLCSAVGAALALMLMALSMPLWLSRNEPPSFQPFEFAYVVYDVGSGAIQEAHMQTGEFPGRIGCSYWNNGSSQVGNRSCLDVTNDPNRDFFFRDTSEGRMHVWMVDLGTLTLVRTVS